MANQPPPVDDRTAADITRQVNDLLAAYLPNDPQTPLAPDDPIRRALIGVFARFSELIIQRLNQVPQKNFLAFLNLLGASRLPPQSARVPLTFSLAVGSAADAVVPTGTQVAAPPPDGEPAPILFETERELVVTAAQLASVFVRHPESDQYADYSDLANLTTMRDVPIFRGDRRVQHILYLGNSQLFSFARIRSLTLVINLSKPLEDNGTVQWQVWDGKTWQNRQPINAENTVKNLQKTGDNLINFDFSAIANATELIPIRSVNGESSRWIRGVLTPAIAPDSDQKASPQTGRVRSSKLPEIRSIQFKATIANSELVLDAAFTNQFPIESNKPFFPFGEKPKFGDVFYLANQEVFSQGGATITLTIDVSNPADYLGMDPRIIEENRKNQNPTLNWEIWEEQSQTWKVIGISDKNNRSITSAMALATNFSDDTQAFTQIGKKTVQFSLPKTFLPKLTRVNGVENFWIRVRIAKGDYGKEASFEEKRQATDKEAGIYGLKPASFVPPVIAALTVGYTRTLDQQDNVTPEKIITYNNAVFKSETTQPFAPFVALREIKPSVDLTSPTLYLGFTLPPNRLFPNLPLSVYVQTAEFKYEEKSALIAPTGSKLAANPGQAVTHTFWLTNSGASAVTYTLSLAGMRQDTPWPTAIVDPTSPLRLEPGQSRKVLVQVTVPSTIAPTATPLESRDRGILQVRPVDPPEIDPPEIDPPEIDPPEIVNTATFVTFARQVPQPQQAHCSWQYWTGLDWNTLRVQDGSENFTRSGLIEFLPPADFAPRADFGQTARYWMRVQWDGGEYNLEPRLRRLLLNTTIAAQTITLRNEILGSSNGSENQTVRTTKAPVLEGQYLQVREPELPSADESTQLTLAASQLGGAATEIISQVLDKAGRPQEIWVCWQEVPDFYGSGPRDRHYVLDHITGEIRFGNGLNGLIPPIGSGNLRMTRYQTGGGSTGNRPAGAIVQLKTTVPYIDQVTNPEPATGGADAEMLDALLARSPRTIRHRERAVTVEDYEDLAMLASPTVVRAKCVPLRNLAVDPTDQRPPVPGEVSVLIVPTSTEAKPLPSLELIHRVQDYLQAHSLPTVNVSVVGPLYVQVSITAEIALTSLEGASDVEQAIVEHLTRFLHPLTGGFEGTGWEFGREPYKSDFYRLLEGIPGVDHIRTLEVNDGKGNDDVKKIKDTRRFLVYSGQHTITLTFAD